MFESRANPEESIKHIIQSFQQQQLSIPKQPPRRLAWLFKGSHFRYRLIKQQTPILIGLLSKTSQAIDEVSSNATCMINQPNEVIKNFNQVVSQGQSADQQLSSALEENKQALNSTFSDVLSRWFRGKTRQFLSNWQKTLEEQRQLLFRKQIELAIALVEGLKNRARVQSSNESLSALAAMDKLRDGLQTLHANTSYDCLNSELKGNFDQALREIDLPKDGCTKQFDDYLERGAYVKLLQMANQPSSPAIQAQWHKSLNEHLLSIKSWNKKLIQVVEHIGDDVNREVLRETIDTTLLAQLQSLLVHQPNLLCVATWIKDTKEAIAPYNTFPLTQAGVWQLSQLITHQTHGWDEHLATLVDESGDQALQQYYAWRWFERILKEPLFAQAQLTRINLRSITYASIVSTYGEGKMADLFQAIDNFLSDEKNCPLNPAALTLIDNYLIYFSNDHALVVKLKQAQDKVKDQQWVQSDLINLLKQGDYVGFSSKARFMDEQLELCPKQDNQRYQQLQARRRVAITELEDYIGGLIISSYEKKSLRKLLAIKKTFDATECHPNWIANSQLGILFEKSDLIFKTYDSILISLQHILRSNYKLTLALNQSTVGLLKHLPKRYLVNIEEIVLKIINITKPENPLYGLMLVLNKHLTIDLDLNLNEIAYFTDYANFQTILNAINGYLMEDDKFNLTEAQATQLLASPYGQLPYHAYWQRLIDTLLANKGAEYAETIIAKLGTQEQQQALQVIKDQANQTKEAQCLAEKSTPTDSVVTTTNHEPRHAMTLLQVLQEGVKGKYKALIDRRKMQDLKNYFSNCLTSSDMSSDLVDEVISEAEYSVRVAKSDLQSILDERNATLIIPSTTNFFDEIKTINHSLMIHIFGLEKDKKWVIQFINHGLMHYCYNLYQKSPLQDEKLFYILSHLIELIGTDAQKEQWTTVNRAKEHETLSCKLMCEHYLNKDSVWFDQAFEHAVDVILTCIYQQTHRDLHIVSPFLHELLANKAEKLPKYIENIQQKLSMNQLNRFFFRNKEIKLRPYAILQTLLVSIQKNLTNLDGLTCIADKASYCEKLQQEFHQYCQELTLLPLREQLMGDRIISHCYSSSGGSNTPNLTCG